MKLKHLVETFDSWGNWKESYNNYVPRFIEEAKSKVNYQEWDQDTFREFFEQARDQCVSSLQQGYFSNSEKSEIKENWHKLAPLFKAISESQHEMKLEVYEAIDKEISKYTTQHRRASINRLIASLQPKLLCTVVNRNKLNELIDFLNQHMDDCSINKRKSWFKNSNAVLNYFVNELDRPAEEIMTFPWQVYDYYTNNELNKAQSNFMDDPEDQNDNAMKVLNTILYGPPGTGKTFNTINEAIEIADPSYSFEGKTRKTIVDDFQSLLYDEKLNPNGQIMFTTFHQAMSYEDFIEGIKPNIVDDEDDDENSSVTKDLDYIIKDGIFKQIVSLAKKKTKSAVDFDQLWGDYLNLLRVVEGEKLFTSVSSELRLEKESISDSSIKVRFKKSWNPEEEEGTKAFIVSKRMIQRLYDARVDGSEENENGRSDVAKHVGKGRATHIYSVYKDFYTYALSKNAFADDQNLNYVLIIDEINRGNVSSIFGELITLLEDDKRIGEDNELSAILPYSKERFSIPSNLYIIGTMNTADRSVEALDTALRRRFTFKEMMPEPQLLTDKGDNGTGKIGGINLKELLETINKRIEILVDRDHTIGHAFFINNKNIDDLRNTFANKIIPLLQEYFYGDYQKMMMVIGQDFFEETVDATKVEFAIKNSDFTPEGKIYRIKDVSKMTDVDFLVALSKVITPFPKKTEATNGEGPEAPEGAETTDT